jgi:hypothetical protein
MPITTAAAVWNKLSLHFPEHLERGGVSLRFDRIPKRCYDIVIFRAKKRITAVESYTFCPNPPTLICCSTTVGAVWKGDVL